MIHKVFLSELNKKTPDITKVSQLLQQGRKAPWSMSNFLGNVYENIRILDRTEGDNTVFHLLAEKGILGKVIGTLFSNAESILGREGVTYQVAKNQSKSDAAKLVMFKLLHIENAAKLTSVEQALVSKDFKCIEYLVDLSLQKYSKFSLGLDPILDLIVSNKASQGISVILDKLADANYLQIIAKTGHNSVVKILNKLGYLLENQGAEKFTIDQKVIANIVGIEAINDEEYNKLLSAFNLSTGQMNDLLGGRSNLGRLEVIKALKHKAILGSIGFAIDLKNKSKNFDSKENFLSKIFPNAANILDIEKIKLLDDFIQDKFAITSEEIKKIQGKKEVIQENKENLKEEKKEEKKSVVIKVLKDSNGVSDLKEQKQEILITKKSIEADYSQYLEGVKKYLITKYSQEIEKGLGQQYNDLQFYLYVTIKYEKQFTKILKYIAKNLSISPISLNKYIKVVVDSAKEEDFSFLGSRKKTALEIACLKAKTDWVKAILEKGAELKVYNNDTLSIYQAAISDNVKPVLKYLLSEQKIVQIKWENVLFDCIKYGNLDAVKYYVQSGVDIIEKSVDRSKNSNEEIVKKYTLLNYGMDRLIHLAELKFHSRLSKEERQKKEKAAVIKMNEIAKCLVFLIDKDKMYYSNEEYIVNKTAQLLYQVSKYQLGLQEKIKNNLESLHTKITKEYSKEEYPFEIRKIFETIANGVYPDDVSQAGSLVSGYSVLEQVYNDQNSDLMGDTENNE
jgi:hypothetical protein